jgi:hypothetical protein
MEVSTSTMSRFENWDGGDEISVANLLDTEDGTHRLLSCFRVDRAQLMHLLDDSENVCDDETR